jgi:benzoyl-CoA reductase/2-hydroxyglutaryl-CoA dehydratase subunit BcrC/BadD/HgdB
LKFQISAVILMLGNSNSDILEKLYSNKRNGKPVIGCFPLYPPLELFHAMGLIPVVLWGLRGFVRETPHSDKHLQPYVCSVARHLTEFLLSEGRALLDGIWMYNACDTLRNLPEIFIQEFASSGRKIPVIEMHIPMAPRHQTNSNAYFEDQIRSLIGSIKECFKTSFSMDAFQSSLTLYNRMRKLALEAEQRVADGHLSFLDFVRVMQEGWLSPVEDHIAALESMLDLCNGRPLGSAKNSSAPGVIVSGILPPPESIILAIEGAGLRMVGNDIASMRRSYADIHEGPADPVGYYHEFYMNHYPCPTLLYAGDRRLKEWMAFISQSGARGVVFVGEKFCEYEYFEFPYLEKQFKQRGIASLLIEVSIEDESHASAHHSRIEAFAEMIHTMSHTKSP